MTPIATPLAGAFVVEGKRFEDERGFFSRPYDQGVAFGQMGVTSPVVEENVSFNHRRGTLRGMHFQVAPKAQPKLVRCTMGAIWDCIVDLRPESATFKKWFGVELTAENRKSLFIPAGFAHGFLTLTDNAEVLYLMHEVYAPDCAGGVRWDDPAFGIRWPGEVVVIHERDAGYADFGG